MTDALAQQIRDAFTLIDEAQGSVDIDAVRERRVGEWPVRPVQPVAPRPRRRWSVAVAAAVATLSIVGGASLMLRVPGGTEPDVATTLPDTTVPDPELAGYDHVRYFHDGEWAIGEVRVPDHGFQSFKTLLSRADGSWQVVPIPKPALSGVRWGNEWGDMVLLVEAVVGDTALLRANAPADVPWGDYFGLFEGQCGDIRCLEQPDSAYDESSSTVVVRSPGGTRLAALTVGVEGQDVVFTDVDSGEQLHKIGTSGSGLSPDQIVAWIRASGDRGRGPIPPVDWGFVVSRSDLVPEIVGSPLGPDASGLWEVVAIGGTETFVAVDTAEDGAVTVWTSVDLRNWIERASLGNSVTHPDVVAGPGRVAVKIITADPGGLEPGQWWQSEDGITWTRFGGVIVDSNLQGWQLEVGESGYVARLSEHEAWMSTDGITWEMVDPDEVAQLESSGD